jgi:hypothetical protein
MVMRDDLPGRVQLDRRDLGAFAALVLADPTPFTGRGCGT